MKTKSVILNEKVEEFLELENGSPDFLIQMLDSYLKTSHALLSLLRETLEDGNIEEFKRHVHTLKGSSLNLGLEEMSDETRQIEEEVEISFAEKNKFRHKIDILAKKLESVMSCRENLAIAGAVQKTLAEV